MKNSFSVHTGLVSFCDHRKILLPVLHFPQNAILSQKMYIFFY